MKFDNTKRASTQGDKTELKSTCRSDEEITAELLNQKEVQFVALHPRGLHFRPSYAILLAAQPFEDSVIVSHVKEDGATVSANANSILNLTTMMVAKNEIFTVDVSDVPEEHQSNIISKLLEHPQFKAKALIENQK